MTPLDGSAQQNFRLKYTEEQLKRGRQILEKYGPTCVWPASRRAKTFTPRAL